MRTEIELASAIERVMQGITFYMAQHGTVSAAEVRHLYENLGHTERHLAFMSAASVLPKKNEYTKELERVLRNVLREYLDEKSGLIGNGMAYVEGGGTHFAIHQFPAIVLCAAAISGARETARKIIGWAEGEPMEYDMEALIAGGKLEGQEIHNRYGVRIEQLPKQPEALLKIIPVLFREKADYIKQSGWPNYLRLRVRCEAKPVFLKDFFHSKIEIQWGREWSPMGIWWSPMQNPVKEICEALSIITEVPVSKCREWNNYGDPMI